MDSASTVLNRGDLLRVGGAKRDVERVGRALGYVERPSSETDVVFVGLGIFLGGLFGLLTLTVAGVPLSLTASGGALVMGLVFGWLRSVRPTFGRIPEPALWVFDTIGLATFIGIVGLNAGPGFVSGLRETGPSLLVAGVLVLTGLGSGHLGPIGSEVRPPAREQDDGDQARQRCHHQDHPEPPRPSGACRQRAAVAGTQRTGSACGPGSRGPARVFIATRYPPLTGGSRASSAPSASGASVRARRWSTATARCGRSEASAG